MIYRLVLLAIFALQACGEKQEPKKEKIEVGMDANEVREILGGPTEIKRYAVSGETAYIYEGTICSTGYKTCGCIFRTNQMVLIRTEAVSEAKISRGGT